jgi:hypothetical protein
MTEKIEIPSSELVISVDDVLRAQGAKPEVIHARRPAIVESTQQAIEMGLQKVHLIGWLQELPVRAVTHDRIQLADGHVLTGSLVMQKLAGSTSVYFAIGTIGAGLEQYVTQNLQEDSAFCYILDTVGSVCAEKFGQYLESTIRKRAKAQEKLNSISISPGLIGWPVDEGQPQIFEVLQPEPELVQLSTSAQMLPRKSISFVMGIGCPEGKGTQCDYSELRDRCQNRANN